LFLNRGSKAQNVEFEWAEHLVKDDLTKRYFDFKRKRYELRDLWSRKNRGSTASTFKTTLPSHDVIMLRLKPRG
jgi:alpha-galactosidase